MNNYWLSLALVACTALAVRAESPGQAVSLFDGKTLTGWEGKEKFWSVKDGAITGQTTKENPTQGNTFLIWRGGELEDFELTLKFRIEGHNSGIQYRSVELPNFVVSGYQADIDASHKFIGILYEERGRGILANRCKKVVIGDDGKKQVAGTTSDEAELLKSIKKEDWNEYKIIAKGNHLQQMINGYVTVDVTDNGPQARAKGILALQLHAGPPMVIQFKDIMLKRLK